MASSASQSPCCGQDEGVDLGQRRVFFQIRVVQLPRDRREPRYPVGREPERKGNLPRLPGVQPEERVDEGAHDPLWPLASDLFDVDTALRARHDHVLTTCAIEGDPEVELLSDVDGGRDQHLAYRVSANVETEDRRGNLAGLCRCAGELDAACLAAASREDLGFHHDWTTRGLSKCRRLIRGGGNPTGVDAEAMAREDLRRLVLVQIHNRVLAFQTWVPAAERSPPATKRWPPAS